MEPANVSVIMPHYNATSTVGRSISSVLQQSLRVKELIIVDDCSSHFEELLDIVKSFGDTLPIKMARLKVNSGASEARNHGVEIATGKYLAFLDSDDVWHPNKIEIQYGLMERNNIQFSGHFYIPDLNRLPMASDLPLRTKAVLPTRFVLGNPFFTPTVMVRREGFIQFDRRYRRVDDYKCWLMNIYKNNGTLILLPLAGGFKPAIGSSGLTSSLKIMHESYLIVLNDLHRERHIGLAFFLLARMIELIKYPVRIVKSKFRNDGGH